MSHDNRPKTAPEVPRVAAEAPRRPEPDTRRELLRTMLRIRRMEERAYELYTLEKIRGFLHLYDGEEAVAAGVINQLRGEDGVLATYREHGHALARGVSMGSIMAEMYGKSEGCSGGRGGSMHLYDRDTNFFGGTAIVGNGLPMAAGLGLARKMRGEQGIICCFFGEGAVDEGEFHESLNLAALWDLPVLFVCENNLYSMGMSFELAEAETDLVRKAASYGVSGCSVDGMEVDEVWSAAGSLASEVRGGGGPRFLECRTYRYRAHSMFDPERYRSRDEVREWRERDPLPHYTARLEEEGLISAEQMEAMESEVQKEVEDAVRFAEEGNEEAVDDLFRFVYAEAQPSPGRPEGQRGETDGAEASPTTYREAVRRAMSEAMREDNRVFLMGEDVGRYGGCFNVSEGMLQEFGEQRVLDTPLSESGFTGCGIGASLGGMRPIVEIMTVNFSLLAADQIINTAAILFYMSGGQFNVPLVIRMATGGGKQLAAQHSRSLEGWYAHIPGLKILAPATVEDAYGMLCPALDDPNPVLIFEHSTLYNLEGILSPVGRKVDIRKAAVRREGGDLTILTYGMGLWKSLEAADRLSSEGIEAEVVDLRVLRPLDNDTILHSVSKTHRVLIVDEGWRSGGLSAELAARVAEELFYELDAPIVRVCGEEVPAPYAAQLEKASLPQAEDIVRAARKMGGHHG